LNPLQWLPVVAAAHDAGVEIWTQGTVTVRRVRGGFNNALYRVEAEGGSYACKLCVADGRRRAAREYGTLRLLRATGLDIAPQPLCLDESCALVPFPAVIYRWLPGVPLGPSPTAQQLSALLDTYHRIHALRREEMQHIPLLEAGFHWFDFAPYVAELYDFLEEYGTWLAASDPDGPTLRDRLAHLVTECVQTLITTTVDPGRGRFPLRLCRVDPNLANAVWGRDGRLRWVDWEYSGWGDPALDLADLRWHAALDGLSGDEHKWLRENYCRPERDPGFEARLAMWDCLLATRWPFVTLRILWSAYNGPDRLRLTRPAVEPGELRARLIRFIERAEKGTKI
jgi:Ser/Thr protein kinase RdoA (MazF antagonist)